MPRALPSKSFPTNYSVTVRHCIVCLLTASAPEGLSREIKRPEREADHSPQHNAEVKNTWIYTYIIPYVFIMRHIIVVIKHRENFTGSVIQ
jgi:hypothetical protein